MKLREEEGRTWVSLDGSAEQVVGAVVLRPEVARWWFVCPRCPFAGIEAGYTSAVFAGRGLARHARKKHL